jgi:2-dehydropantoate 2-reductase
MKQEFLIVGTGALATLFAARLSEAGHSVTMLGTWKNGLDALRESGARLINTKGMEQAYRVRVTDDPIAFRDIKYAFVLVKAWQTERAARQLRECLARDGLAVTLQNGLGNREILAQILDPLAIEKTGGNNSKNSTHYMAKNTSRVVLGTTTTGATLLGPGLARAGGEGVISIERHPALGPMEEALKSSNFNVHIVDDAQSLVWGKLVINAAINPLTALLRVPNGELLERPEARKLMSALARETAKVAGAEHVHLPFGNPVDAVEDVARKTAANHSSMFQDVRRGAPTEIDAICGAVVKAGKKHNLRTPANWACWHLVKAMASVS